MGLAAVLDLDEGPRPAGTFFPSACACWLPIVTADCCLSSTQMQRLQQWEAQMLLEIEEAVHHELTIQDGILSTEFPDQTQGPLSFGTVRVEAQDPATLE